MQRAAKVGMWSAEPTDLSTSARAEMQMIIFTFKLDNIYETNMMN